MKGKREINRRFLVFSIVLLIVLGLPLILLGSRLSRETFFIGYLIGCLATWILAFAFFSLLTWSYKKSDRIFFIILFGGMAAKIMILLAVIALAITIFGVNYLWLIVTVMVYYLAFLVLEILFFTKYFR
jgi:hypothetical protein